MERSYERSRYSERERRHLFRELLAREAVVIAQDRTLKLEVRLLALRALDMLRLKDAIDKAPESQTELQVEPEKPPKKTRVEPVQATQIADEERTYPAGPDVLGGIAAGDASGGVTTKPLRRVGIFWYRESVAQRKMEDSESGFSLNRGDSYIELHVATQEPKESALRVARDSLALLADHIRQERLEPKYVLGVAITPEAQRIAGVSVRMGFKLAPLTMPSEISNAIEEVNRISRREGLGSHVDQPILVFQRGEDFMKNFPSSSAPSASE